MKTPKHILVPVDFSAACLASARRAGELARRFGAEVRLLHVFDLPVYNEEGLGIYTEATLRSLETAAKKKLKDFQVPELEGLTVIREVAMGGAAANIVEVSEKNEDTMIVMPTHGRTVFRQLLMGSVTSAVLHDAHCPVWTSAHAETDESCNEIRRILCAVDIDETTTKVLQAGLACAAAWNANLRVVHARPEPQGFFDNATSDKAHLHLIEEAREKYPDLAEAANCRKALEILEGSGSVADIVAKEAAADGADLLVIGRGEAHGFLGRLRSHAHNLIRQSPCPVLSV
jgi:nucleotide-binding universal stress UspA family protein